LTERKQISAVVNSQTNKLIRYKNYKFLNLKSDQTEICPLKLTAKNKINIKHIAPTFLIYGHALCGNVPVFISIKETKLC